MFDHTTREFTPPLRANDRRTGSVAVHAMLGAKWSALVNQARILRTQHWQMYCIMYEVLRTRIYMFRIQHSRISTGGVVACAPCPGDIKPKCQEFQEFQEFQAPSRCILSLVVELHKTMPIYTSFFQRLCGMYGVPLSGQLPVLEYPKPWFLERVFSAIVWAVFVSPKKGPCSSAAFTL